MRIEHAHQSVVAQHLLGDLREHRTPAGDRNLAGHAFRDRKGARSSRNCVSDDKAATAVGDRLLLMRVARTSASILSPSGIRPPRMDFGVAVKTRGSRIVAKPRFPQATPQLDETRMPIPRFQR